MAQPPADQSDPAGSSGLRRSVGEATERIHEIIDAAERVAAEIRSDAETEARTYVAERRAEADRAAQERSTGLDQLTKSLADTAERFKHEAERMLADLDRAIVDARAGIYRHGALAALGDEPSAQAPRDEPKPAEREPLAPERDRFSVSSFGREPLEPLAPVEPKADPFELPPLGREAIERDRPVAPVSAYPGRAGGDWRPQPAAGGGDQTSEALLRATQLAVTGKDRAEIADVLRTDFPGVDSEPLLDEILG